MAASFFYLSFTSRKSKNARTFCMLTFFKKDNRITQSALVQLFISYSRKDNELVDRIQNELIKKDYKTWIDRQDILPTAEWWNVILEAIDHSAIFLFVVSEHSLASETCGKELKYAVDTGKKIVTLIIENFEQERTPEFLHKFQSVTWVYDHEITNNIELLRFALNIDLAWHALRTSLLTQTTFWKLNNETRDVLLKGNMLLNAESWLDDSYKDKNKLITYDQRRFILISRKGVARENLVPVLNGFILMILGNLLIRQIGADLITPLDPQGIISLELAGNQNRVNEILANWSSSGLIETAKSTVIMDYVFIYGYLLFFIYAFRYFIAYFKRRRKLLSRIGSFLLSMVLLAGVLDVAENICMTIILGGSYLNITTLLFAVSVLKFVLVITCMLYMIFSFIYTLILKKRIEAIETFN
jgi:hypothetical protein